MSLADKTDRVIQGLIDAAERKGYRRGYDECLDRHKQLRAAKQKKKGKDVPHPRQRPA